MKIASIFATAIFAAVPALAGVDISWVASNGSDANDCSFNTPCRTFQNAANKLNTFGAVKAINAADYGPITIQIPIVIDGNGVGHIEIPNGPITTGINIITSNATGPVIIRNLSIHISGGCGFCYGITP